MSKTFRAWDVDQGWGLPPSLHDHLPPGHLAHLVRDTVRESTHAARACAACQRATQLYQRRQPHHAKRQVVDGAYQTVYPFALARRDAIWNVGS